MAMPAGIYYIGDLCYVMNKEWDEFCELTIVEGNHIKEGEMKLADGRAFAAYSTAYGDGEYTSNYGHVLGVDAGLIGCIRVDDITDAFELKLDELGCVVEFAHEFNTYEEAGIITFGHISINTDWSDDDDYDDEPDVSEGQEWHDFDPDC